MNKLLIIYGINFMNLQQRIRIAQQNELVLQVSEFVPCYESYQVESGKS
ncbi:hypothetical protein [Shewanella pealeana]|nr:hypothetical protein [Shewanella pealeana]